MSHASAAGWSGASSDWRNGPFPRRGLEIAAVVVGFVFVWPASVGYLVWKFAGYPVPKALEGYMNRHFDRSGSFWRGCGAKMRESARDFADGTFARDTGNLAFEEYRQAELKRLDEERRRLDDEAREFSSFVEELKRAKDREEFDAFMKNRRAAAPRADA